MNYSGGGIHKFLGGSTLLIKSRRLIISKGEKFRKFPTQDISKILEVETWRKIKEKG